MFVYMEPFGEPVLVLTWNQTLTYGSGPDVYIGPFWKGSGTDKNGSKTGTAKSSCLDPFQTGSRLALGKAG